MAWIFQLDTLKIRAYGVKNAAHVKEEKQLSASKAEAAMASQRQYPKTKEGNYDEWAAMMAN